MVLIQWFSLPSGVMLRVHADVLREEEVASFYLRIISPASISARKRIETGKKEKQNKNKIIFFTGKCKSDRLPALCSSMMSSHYETGKKDGQQQFSSEIWYGHRTTLNGQGKRRDDTTRIITFSARPPKRILSRFNSAHYRRRKQNK